MKTPEPDPIQEIAAAHGIDDTSALALMSAVFNGILPPERGLLRMEEELAWQLATVLWVMSRDKNRARHHQWELILMAASLAQWIRAAHCREVRLLFPGPPHAPADGLSCKIADKLRLGPHSTRDLVRCCDRQRTDAVRGVLCRMRDEGWVAEPRRDRWKLNFPPLPESSVNLSKIAKWPLQKLSL